MLNSLFSLLDDDNSYKPVKAPFSFPGTKSRLAKDIVKHLPKSDSYIEPFGGSMAVLLYREPSTLEVYNDRFGGVVSFYRSLRDRPDALVKELELIPFAREEFYRFKQTIDYDDDLKRGAFWFYITKCSFAGVGRNFGITRNGRSQPISYKYLNSIDRLKEIHERIRAVVIENHDFRYIINRYDDKNAVFYLDPPYAGTDDSQYEHQFTEQDHQDLMHSIENMKSFVALSCYENSVYDADFWDRKIEFSAYQSVNSTVGDGKKEFTEERADVKEILLIKEAVK